MADKLQSELDNLKTTISLCNPAYQAYENDWKSHKITDEKTLQSEGRVEAEFSRMLSKKPADSLVNDVEVRRLLESPSQECISRSVSPPKQVWRPKSKEKSTSKMDDSIFASSEEELCGMDNLGLGHQKPAQVVPVKKIPRAKRTNMDGILHGLPGQAAPAVSRSKEEYFYDNQMQNMIRDKDVSNFRKRDKYSEYVEARARFSKMHSVN